jgi:hypothetical protein
VGEADGGLLEDGAAREHPRTAATPLGPLPDILAEALRSVLRLDGRRDAVLEGEEVGADGGGVFPVWHGREV